MQKKRFDPKIILFIEWILAIVISSYYFQLNQGLYYEQQMQRNEVALEHAENVINSQKIYYHQNQRYDTLIHEVVHTLVKNDTEYGIGGFNPDIPAYTTEELLSAILNQVETSRSDEWFNHVGTFFEDRENFKENIPDVFPIARKYFHRITSGFGMRPWPFAPDIFHFHEGVDIGADENSPVNATADGVVTGVWHNHEVLGKIVYITHENGYETRYAHLNAITVEYLQQIKKGDIIGLVGNTGKSAGVHLHYEIRRYGDAIDPVKFWLIN